MTDEERMRAIAEGVVARVLKRIDARTTIRRNGIWLVSSRDLKDEADRLAKPDNEPGSASDRERFEGVKYVVSSYWPDRCWRVVDQDDYPFGPPAGAQIFLQAPSGQVTWGSSQSLYTPWRPKKDEKVRDEKRPEQVGVIRAITPASAFPYAVEWASSGRWAVQALSDLCPFKFAPEEKPEEAKRELEKGELVVVPVGDHRALRVADGNGALTNLNGDPAFSHPGAVLASDEDVEKSLRHYTGIRQQAVRILRDHFRGMVAMKDAET